MIVIESPRVREPRELADEVLELASGRPLAIATDFDGTISDLVEIPDAAVLREDAREALVALSRTCSILVSSGRRLDDLMRRVPLDGVALAGEHGGDLFLPAGRFFRAKLTPEAVATLACFRELARRILAGTNGFVERKRLATAAHTRRVPEAERIALERTLAREAIALARPGVVEPVVGKMVVELRVPGASKEAALWRFAGSLSRETLLVALGDDATDEDLFRGANAVGGLTIKVGPGRTCARRALHAPSDVGAFLGGLAAGRSVGLLSSHRGAWGASVQTRKS